MSTRGEHIYTCRGCSKRDICGDCIRTYCFECEQIIRANHPGDICPCRDCADQRLQDELSNLKSTEIVKLSGKFARLESYLLQRIEQRRGNLRLWESGHLTPTEPDEEERAAVMRELRAAMAEAEEALKELRK